MQALIVNNDELSRKLREAEETLQRRLSDHEAELEELTNRLEEARSELGATRREEKELRTKEVCAPYFVWPNSDLTTRIEDQLDADRDTRNRNRAAAKDAGHRAVVISGSEQAVPGAVQYVVSLLRPFASC